jgi:F-type H+-transporting ATPase subunit delta
MRTSRALAKQITETYAGVLYDAAAAENAVDAVGGQLGEVMSVVRGHADLRNAMTDDSLPADSRVEVLRSIFPPLPPVIDGALAVMVEQENFDLFPAVVEAYDRVAEERRNIVVADVTTAIPLTESLRQSISDKLSADIGQAVVLREKVDPAIIGGIVIDAAGRRIDASIVSQLENARAVLSTNALTGGGA